MTPEIYSTITDQTALYKRPDFKWYSKDLVPGYLVLGLIGEIGEFIHEVEVFPSCYSNLIIEGYPPLDTPLVKEGGDVMWYTNGLCKQFNISGVWPGEIGEFEVIYQAQIDSAVKNLTKTAFDLSEMMKKYYRDGKLDIIVLAAHLNVVLSIIQVILAGYLKGVTLMDVAEVNYNKLLSRSDRGALQGSGNDR